MQRFYGLVLVFSVSQFVIAQQPTDPIEAARAVKEARDKYNSLQLEGSLLKSKISGLEKLLQKEKEAALENDSKQIQAAKEVAAFEKVAQLVFDAYVARLETAKSLLGLPKVVEPKSKPIPKTPQKEEMSKVPLSKAKIIVNTYPDALVFINGQRTTSKGPTREFDTGLPSADQSYDAELTVTRDNMEIFKKKISIRAGETVILDAK